MKKDTIQKSEPVVRRGSITSLLYGGLTALFSAALYPILRNIIPPTKGEDSSSMTVLAANAGEL